MPARLWSTDDVGSPAPNGARAVPARLHTLVGGREADAPWMTRVLSVKPNGCV